MRVFTIAAPVWCEIAADIEDEALNKFQERLNQAYYEHGETGLYMKFTDPEVIEESEEV